MIAEAGVILANQAGKCRRVEIGAERLASIVGHDSVFGDEVSDEPAPEFKPIGGARVLVPHGLAGGFVGQPFSTRHRAQDFVAEAARVLPHPLELEVQTPGFLPGLATKTGEESLDAGRRGGEADPVKVEAVDLGPREGCADGFKMIVAKRMQNRGVGAKSHAWHPVDVPGQHVPGAGRNQKGGGADPYVETG